MSDERQGTTDGVKIAKRTIATAVTAAGILVGVGAAQAEPREYWLLDDGSGTSAANEVGGGNTATLVGPPAWITTGLEPKLTDRSVLPSTAALDFDPGDHVDCGNIGLTSTSTGGEVTVSMWLRPDTLSGDVRLIGHLSGVTTQAGTVGVGQSAGVGGVWVWHGGGFGHLTSAGALTAGSWQHLALVWNRGQVTAYLDGVAQLTATADFGFGAGNGNFGLAAKYVGTYGDGFNGQIDDVAIYGSALTPSQIEELANPPTGTDPTVTLDGSTSWGSIAANAPVGMRVGVLSMVNTNPAGFAYALDAGGDTTHFEIPGGMSNLVVKTALGAGPYALKIVGTDGGFTVTNDFTIRVTAPITVSLSNTDVTTNAVVGSLVGTLSMVNAGSQEGFTYALDPSGDTTHFAISDTDKLLTAEPLDVGSYDIVIRATNAIDGFWVTNAFTVLVDPPDPLLGPCSRFTPVIISEIMYHPKAREDRRNGEFVELFNTQLMDLDVGGWRLTGEIGHEFPPGTLLRGRRSLVVAKDPAAYSGVLGPYSGALDNAGGTVRIKNNHGATLLEARYSSEYPWPIGADGAGHSLILLRPDYGEDDVRAWAASSVMGGTPNLPDPHVRHGYEGVVINEFLAHTDPPLQDSIELFNANNTSVDVSGCWLSDSASVNKFRIPDGTTIAPRGFLVYSNELGFGLSMAGGRIVLVSSNQAAVVNGVKYPAQENAVSCGRYPDGMPDFQPLSARTLGGSNAPPLESDIVINEIMYHPIGGYDDEQYIELYNRGESAVDVGYWRFTDGVDYMVPAGTVIPSGGYLVIAANTTNLQARYPQLDASNTVGDFGGRLSFRGERLVLSRPENAGFPFQDFVTVDAVTYSDGWGRWTDGGGSSLELRDPDSDNRLGMNWAGSDETQKAPWTIVDYTDEVSNGSSERGGTPPYTSPFEVVALMAGEYVVDDIVMASGATTHFSDDLEGGANGWSFKGSHYRSAVESGQGYAGSAGLHIRSSDRGEFSGDYPFFENHAQKNMIVAPQPGTVARIQAKVRWLCGFPYLLMGCRGYWCATPGDLELPTNLGSPGQQNSRYAENAGPAIADVTQSPILPPAGSNVVVTCRVDDPDDVASVSLSYRVDPGYATNTLPMVDSGAGGDRVAGDGIYTAIVPGQSARALVAFVIDATDGAASPATLRFPSKTVPAGAPPSECLMSWGLTKANGVGMPTYRVLITAANNSILNTLGYTSKQNVDCTFLYDDSRAIYGASVRERGNANPSGNVIRLPKDNRVLGANKLTVVNNSYYTDSYLPWLCREVGEPSGYAAPIAYSFGTGGLSFYEDWLGPSTDLCGTWFGDEDPEVFKNLDYSVDAFGMITNRFGMKKSRYAALSVKRAMRHPNDDYTQVFKIARAVNTADTAKFIKRTEAVIDVRCWASYFALAGLFGDWDKYGYAYSHNCHIGRQHHRRQHRLQRARGHLGRGVEYGQY